MQLLYLLYFFFKFTYIKFIGLFPVLVSFLLVFALLTNEIKDHVIGAEFPFPKADSTKMLNFRERIDSRRLILLIDLYLLLKTLILHSIHSYAL